MATGKNPTPAPAAPAKPTVKLVPLTDDLYDAIALRGGKGRPAKPSALLNEVRAAVDAMPVKGYENDKDGWYVLKATAANTNEVHARELRKGVKQVNADRKPADHVKVEIRPRENHETLGAFVAWRVSPAPVEEPAAETPSGEASAE